MKLTFIGFGKFARAFLKGLNSQPSLSVVVCSPSLKPGERVLGACTACDNRLAVKNAEWVILVVKPAQVGAVMTEIGSLLPPQSVLISVAAGVSIAKLASFCLPGYKIVRAMPNMPIAIQQGAIGLYGEVDLTLKNKLTELFSYLGHCQWVADEKDLDSLTALSGSGPAYVFLFLEALIAAAVDLGLNESLAKSFAIETLLGSCLLAKQSTESLPTLRAQVTSPGGTTEAALAQLHAGNFTQLIDKAIKAAFDRAQELR